MPFDVNVNTLDAALQLASGAAQPNGGLAIDTWHMSKLGIGPKELERIPVEHLVWVELSDGRMEDMPDLIEETVNHRRLPGEGEFDIPGYVDACREAGYPGPWGVEVLSEELRKLPIEQEFKRAYETTAAQFRVERSTNG
jgi:sugar phosphate isomerase/epimerase